MLESFYEQRFILCELTVFYTLNGVILLVVVGMGKVSSLFSSRFSQLEIYVPVLRDTHEFTDLKLFVFSTRFMDV